MKLTAPDRLKGHSKGSVRRIQRRNRRLGRSPAIQNQALRSPSWLTGEGGPVRAAADYEDDVQAQLLPKALKARRQRLARDRQFFDFQDAYREWCVERFMEADGPMVTGTFTVRPGRFKSRPHALAVIRKWTRKVERFTLKGGSLEVHAVIETHESGELHVHILLPSLPRWFRLSDWRTAWERWFPLAERSPRSLTGALGVRFRVVKSAAQASYAGKYVAKDLLEGGEGLYVFGSRKHGMLFDVGRTATGVGLVSTGRAGEAPASPAAS